MVDSVKRPDAGPAIAVGLVASGTWALAGFGLLALARRRCGDIIRKHEAMLAEAERLLAEEDAAESAVAEAPPAEGEAAQAPDAAPAEPAAG